MKCGLPDCARKAAEGTGTLCARHYAEMAQRPGLRTVGDNYTKPNLIWKLMRDQEPVEIEEMASMGKEKYVEEAFARMRQMIAKLAMPH